MPIERRRAGLLEGFTSIVVNTALFAVKFFVGLIYGSLAVVADAVHTLSDTFTSLVLVLGYRVASKPPDVEHPFGHGRAEDIAALVIGVVLGFVGFEIALAGYERLARGEALAYSDVLVYALVASALVKFLLGLWAYRLGVKYSSKPVIGDAYHHLADASGSTLVALALYVAGREVWWLDGVLALALSAVVVYVAVNIVYKSTSVLLGRGPGIGELEALIEVAERAHPLVRRVHHVHFHRYGDHVEVTLHVELPGNMSLEDAHRIATLIENEIRRRLGYEATVHVEPHTPTEEHVD